MILISLGQWQLSRRIEKQSWVNNLKSNQKHSISLQALANDDKPSHTYEFHNIEFSGELIENQDFLIDNQIHQKQIGYKVLSTVLTPFGKILVDRGFISKQHYQLHKTVPSTKIKSAYFKGIIYSPPTGIVLNKAHLITQKDDQLPILQAISWPAINQWFQTSQKISLIPAIVKLEASELTFLVDEITVSVSPTKHLAYALQWFSMAAATVLYYLFISVRRESS